MEAMVNVSEKAAREAATIERFEKARAAAAEAMAKEMAIERNARFQKMTTGVQTADVDVMEEDTPPLQMDPNYVMAVDLFSKFQIAFVERDYDTARDILLPQIKDKLATFRSLPPLFGESSTCSAYEHSLARDTYELALLMDVFDVDHDAFERDFSMLRPYYTDGRVITSSSDREYAVLHLNLLRLLLNRIADLRTELESLAAATEQDSFAYIMEIIEIDPKKHGRVFTERRIVNFLLPSIDRDKISGWRMKAHGSSSISDGNKMLLFLCEQKLDEYIKKEHPEWEMKNGFVVSKRVDEKMSKRCKVMMQLLNQSISYVRGI